MWFGPYLVLACIDIRPQLLLRSMADFTRCLAHDECPMNLFKRPSAEVMAKFERVYTKEYCNINDIFG